jgi:hypothetical protein
MPARRSISGHPHRAMRIALLGALLLAAGSCSRLRHGESAPAPSVQIVFINESLEQADVFALSAGGEQVRMGSVAPGRTATLNVPVQFVRQGAVNIAARLLGRGAVIRTGSLTIRDGDRLEVRLPVAANVLSVLPAG